MYCARTLVPLVARQRVSSELGEGRAFGATFEKEDREPDSPRTYKTHQAEPDGKSQSLNLSGSGVANSTGNGTSASVGAVPALTENALRKWFKTSKKWMRRHLFITLLIPIAISLISPWGYEKIKSALYTQPIVTKIQPSSTQVPQGTPVTLHAETWPTDSRPHRYVWGPADKIEGDGQTVRLITKTDERYVDSYSIKVTLVAYDVNENPCPLIEPVTITVVPPEKWNHKPVIKDFIHTPTDNKIIRAGDPVVLKVSAEDDDHDNLTYSWTTDSEAVWIEKDGEPQVILHSPTDFIRSDPLRVKVTVRDGKENGTCEDVRLLTIQPKSFGGRGRKHGRGQPTKYEIILQPPVQPGAQPNVTPSPVAVPHPETSPAAPQQVAQPKTPEAKTSSAKP